VGGVVESMDHTTTGGDDDHVLTSNGYVLDESSHRLGPLQPVPAAERDNRDALWQRLRRDGYLYLTGFLDLAVVHHLRTYYFTALAHTGLLQPGTDPAAGIAGTGQIDQAALRHTLFHHIIPSPTYHQFCTQPAIHNWFTWLLADKVHLHQRKIIRHTRPGHTGIGTATQAHYDLVYLRQGTDRVLSAWIPLGDIPQHLGGLIYLARSHHHTLAQEHHGTLPHPATSITADLPALAQTHNTRWLTTNYHTGDIVIHSAHIIHAALDNIDPHQRIRLSTDIRYQRQTDPIDWRWQNHWHDKDGL
jgi:Phytanoyl-CoA dioxygenase (PhyH)